ncbi:MAG: DUF6427 family protein [Chitinophagaceae bacterium]
MTGIFRSHNPFNVILIFLIGIVLRIHIFSNPTDPVIMPADGFLYVWLVNKLKGILGNQSVLFPLLAYLFVFLQAVLLNTFVNKHKMFTKPNYLIGFLYIVLTALCKEWWVFSSALLINTAIIPVWDNLIGLYKSQKAKSTIFTTGIVIGICSFFYFPAIAFFLLLLVSILILRPFHLPEWITGIIGLLMPYYFLFSISFLKDSWDIHQFLPIPKWGGVLLAYDKWFIVLIIFLAISLILGVYYLLESMNRLAIHSRKAWNLVFYYFIITITLPFLSSSSNLLFFLLAIPPLAAAIANFLFYPQNRVLPNVLAIGFVVYVLFLNFR